MTFKTACVMDNWEWRFHFATIPGPSPEGDGNEDAGLLLWNRKPVSYTHLRAHETVLDLVCRLLLEKKKTQQYKKINITSNYIHHI